MTPGNIDNVILPSWRQGRLLFFTSVVDNYTTRLDYRVAAATLPGDTNVLRTHKAGITPEELALCQETADNGVELQRFFEQVSQGNLDDLTEMTPQNLPPCANGANALIYICSYFNFLRKYSVDQTLIKLYEARKPEERFEPESSFSIYKILSAHLQPERAAALIDADIPDLQKVRGATNSVANLLREVAVIRHDTGDTEAAIQAMRRAVSIHNTEDKWRRLADFAIAGKQPKRAIEFYQKAERITPLAPPQALRMAGLLVETNRPEEAAPFLERAEANFAKQVENLRAKLKEQTEAE
ncbi:MAG: hypothetical protein GQ535_09995 [Rhodobacteraceae bacterium]|nr:hypothetical protein [Paracoccaceae bacterium]